MGKTIKEYVILKSKAWAFENAYKTASKKRAKEIYGMYVSEGYQPILYTRSVSEWQETNVQALEDNAK